MPESSMQLQPAVFALKKIAIASWLIMTLKCLNILASIEKIMNGSIFSKEHEIITNPSLPEFLELVSAQSIPEAEPVKAEA